MGFKVGDRVRITNGWPPYHEATVIDYRDTGLTHLGSGYMTALMLDTPRHKDDLGFWWNTKNLVLINSKDDSLDRLDATERLRQAVSDLREQGITVEVTLTREVTQTERLEL